MVLASAPVLGDVKPVTSMRLSTRRIFGAVSSAYKYLFVPWGLMMTQWSTGLPATPESARVVDTTFPQCDRSNGLDASSQQQLLVTVVV